MNDEKGLVDENTLSAAASGVNKNSAEKRESNAFKTFLYNLKDRLQRIKNGTKNITLRKKKSPEMLEYEKIAGTIGILLFGTQYSGKNTLLLHLQQLFGDQVSVDNFHAPIIHQVIIDGFKNIIEFSKEKGFDLSDYTKEVFEITQCRSDDPILPEQVLSFKRFWSSPFAQQAFDERKNEIFKYTKLEPLEHYVPRLATISKADYIPTFQDVIRIPIKYNKEGIKDLSVVIENIPFKFTALLNNSASNIKKIGLQFDQTQLPIPISCILFMCELPFTDPKSARGQKKIPVSELIKEELKLFERVLSLNCFQKGQSFLILLSKADLFFYQGLRFDTHENIIDEIKVEFQKRWIQNKRKIVEKCRGDSEENEPSTFIEFKVCCNYNEKDIIEIILQLQKLIVMSSNVFLD